MKTGEERRGICNSVRNAICEKRERKTGAEFDASIENRLNEAGLALWKRSFAPQSKRRKRALRFRPSFAAIPFP